MQDKSSSAVSKLDDFASILSTRQLTEVGVKSTNCGLSLCIAIQGGDEVDEFMHNTQKDFSDLMVALTDPNNTAGVQYHTTRTPISTLTANTLLFNKRLFATTLVPGKSNIAAGIQYCTNQLNRLSGYSKVIMLLGNGLASAGGNPVRKAKAFRDGGGHIIAVKFPNSNVISLRDITGDLGSIYTLHDFGNVADAIYKIQERECSIMN